MHSVESRPPLLLVFLRVLALVHAKNADDSTGSASNTTAIWLLGLFPFSGSWPGGLGQLPAIEMGLRDVNADPTMLPGYTLNMTINDTSVSFCQVLYTEVKSSRKRNLEIVNKQIKF